MQLLCDTIEHWEKRNIDALRLLDPAQLDRSALAQYFAKYGGRVAELIDVDPYEYVQRLPIHGRTPEVLDEFVHMQVTGPDDIARRFVDSFYFGCEADDRGVATAFTPSMPGGRMLRAMFSSDIGHWDVPDMSKVVAESFEMVEKGYLSAEQWRRIVCDNPLGMYTRANPQFFDGTSVSAQAMREAAGQAMTTPYISPS
jgi:hypothetical protein